MKVALLIISFNRLNYLKECLWSIENSDKSQVDTILIIDNNSNAETVDCLQQSGFPVQFNTERRGISANLLQGYEQLFQTHDIVINFDSDALIRPDCITRLLELYQPSTLLTGFHSTTEGRHPIISTHDGYVIKKTVGGINFCIDKDAYANYVRPALLATTPHGNFDHVSCLNAGSVMCAVPSLVQHLGIESSLGHSDNPDVADDFYYHYLPSVTLFGVDSNNERLQKSAKACQYNIYYGAVVTLNPDIRSKEQYSEFIIKEAYKHIPTSHVLIFQHDGYVHNWKAWDNSWLEYDYIGAPWWYGDGMDVGNGGFSLRSRRLMEIVATDKYINSVGLYHPEDDVICRKYRVYLESVYGIKFAPLEVAEKFSFEGYKQPTKYLSEQFGRHGDWIRTKPERKFTGRKFVVNQYQGLGDILFLVPLIRALIDEGNEVVWPIADHYFDIAKHFPDLDMRRKSEVDVPYQSRLKTETRYGTLLPYRFAQELMGKSLKECMQAKWAIYGHDWRQWRGLTYKRDKQKEASLLMYLNLTTDSVFQLINVNFGEVERCGKVVVNANPLLPIVEMSVINGYSLIDWLGVIELAKEIHTANTSIMYLLELMTLNKPVYVYKRKTWGEVNFEHTAAIWSNKDFIFEE